MLFSIEDLEEIEKRKEWGFFIHKFHHYGKCLFDRNSNAIGLGIIKYKTLYELIRGINHEILHQILKVECSGGKLDNLVHNIYLDSAFKEELYDLHDKTWKDISVLPFVFKERLIRDFFELKRRLGKRMTKTIEKKLKAYAKRELKRRYPKFYNTIKGDLLW